MSHFAKVETGVVTSVIVAEQSVIDAGEFGDPSMWVQTSYNTFGGKHLLGGVPLRKNYAGIGMLYDAKRDAFYTQQPYPSWTLNEDTCIWEAPIPAPDDGNLYVWREETQTWALIPTQQ